MKGADDYPVTVCAACLCASCWHGEFMCERYLSAGLVEMPASALRALNREHPDRYSREKLARVLGSRGVARGE